MSEQRTTHLCKPRRFQGRAMLTSTRPSQDIRFVGSCAAYGKARGARWYMHTYSTKSECAYDGKGKFGEAATVDAANAVRNSQPEKSNSTHAPQSNSTRTNKYARYNTILHKLLRGLIGRRWKWMEVYTRNASLNSAPQSI